MELDWSLRHVTHTTAFIALLNTEAIFPSFLQLFRVACLFIFSLWRLEKKIELVPPASKSLRKVLIIEYRDVNIKIDEVFIKNLGERDSELHVFGNRRSFKSNREIAVSLNKKKIKPETQKKIFRGVKHGIFLLKTKCVFLFFLI